MKIKKLTVAQRAGLNRRLALGATCLRIEARRLRMTVDTLRQQLYANKTGARRG